MSSNDYANLPVSVVPNWLRGYRLWRINPDLNQLRSLNGVIWPNNEHLRAECLKFGHNLDLHTAPLESCSCGIYARYNPYDLDDVWNSETLVVGVIGGFGTITLGDRGFKSQYATIKGICPAFAVDRVFNTSLSSRVDKLLSEIIEEIAKAYRVPLFKNMKELVEEFPPDDLKALGINVRSGPREDVLPKRHSQPIMTGPVNIYIDPSQSTIAPIITTTSTTSGVYLKYHTNYGY